MKVSKKTAYNGRFGATAAVAPQKIKVDYIVGKRILIIRYGKRQRVKSLCHFPIFIFVFL